MAIHNIVNLMTVLVASLRSTSGRLPQKRHWASLKMLDI